MVRAHRSGRLNEPMFRSPVKRLAVEYYQLDESTFHPMLKVFPLLEEILLIDRHVKIRPREGEKALDGILLPLTWADDKIFFHFLWLQQKLVEDERKARGRRGINWEGPVFTAWGYAEVCTLHSWDESGKYGAPITGTTAW